MIRSSFHAPLQWNAHVLPPTFSVPPPVFSIPPPLLNMPTPSHAHQMPLTSGKIENVADVPHFRAQNIMRFKTELCRAYMETQTCKFGDGCTFAHGQQELRAVPRHPRYKTEQCRTYHATGYCQYGPRCHFVHDDDETVDTSPRPGLRKRILQDPANVQLLELAWEAGVPFDPENVHHLLGNLKRLLGLQQQQCHLQESDEEKYLTTMPSTKGWNDDSAAYTGECSTDESLRTLTEASSYWGASPPVRKKSGDSVALSASTGLGSSFDETEQHIISENGTDVGVGPTEPLFLTGLDQCAQFLATSSPAHSPVGSLAKSWSSGVSMSPPTMWFVAPSSAAPTALFSPWNPRISNPMQISRRLQLPFFSV